MNFFYFIIITFFILSCNKSEIQEPESALINLNDPFQESESTLINLNYPSGYGQTGETSTSVIGYGYNATGICDTLSVRNKILKINNLGLLYYGKPFTSGKGTEISGNSYYDLLRNMEFHPNKVDEPTVSFLSHFKSLLTTGLNTDTIDKSCAYAYYSYLIYHEVYHYHMQMNDVESELTDDFKNDINVLTPEEIVSKYGTHVIIDAVIGSKFEVLYKCDINNGNADKVLRLLYNRMTEYFGYVPGVLYDKNVNYSPKNEKLIFNTLGFSKTLFGLINATNNNSNNIFIDLNTVFDDEKKFQFIKMAKDGLIPLYELISNPDRKQEIKDYIEIITKH